VQQSLGTLSINGSTLTVNAGSSVTSGTQTLAFGATALSGNTTFNVANGASASTQLTLGAVSQDVAGRGLTKSGSGALVLSGDGTYSGATTINGGTLTAAASSGGALRSTSSITVNSGGTLLLGASDQINNTAGVTLSGGTFAKGTFSEGTAALLTSTAGAGALTLSAAGSKLDFGTGTVGALVFGSLTAAGNALTIDNWTGTANLIGSTLTDRLVFNSDQTTNLNYFSFTGYTGATEIALGNNDFAVVPLTAVPEPRTFLPGILGFVAIVRGFVRRARV
jgi:autotransporter-associated beta strand protein